MTLNKRKKSTRYRGSHTHKNGGKKKSRGSGHRGGVGLAGTGKKADQRKTLILKRYGNKYFGKTIPLARKKKYRLKTINLRDIQNKFGGSNVKDIDLKGYKILASGSLKEKFNIIASAASKKAFDKIKALGGVLLIN